MNMRRSRRSWSGLVINSALKCYEHDKNRIAPFVELHFVNDVCSHHFRAEQIRYEMTWVDVRDDQLTSWDLFAACQTHGNSALCFADNFLHKRIRADLAAMCPQVFSQSKRNAIHPAFDQVVADVLQDRCKEPAKLCASSIVRRRA